MGYQIEAHKNTFHQVSNAQENQSEKQSEKKKKKPKWQTQKEMRDTKDLPRKNQAPPNITQYGVQRDTAYTFLCYHSIGIFMQSLLCLTEMKKKAATTKNEPVHTMQN